MNKGKPVREATIRCAKSRDADVASGLILRGMGHFSKILFPAKAENPHNILKKLFTQKHNRFSFQYADILEVDGETAGLLLAYPWWKMTFLAMLTVFQLARECGFSWAKTMLKDVRSFLGAKEASPDEFYINSIAVLPEFSGKGVGSKLLAHAEEKSKKSGLRKCSLTVDIENHTAIRLYEKFGYKIIDTQNIKHYCIHRMVKQLEQLNTKAQQS